LHSKGRGLGPFAAGSFARVVVLVGRAAGVLNIPPGLRRYSAAVVSRKPLDVGALVRQLGTSEPFRLLDVARGHLRAAGKADAVNLLLVDYARRELRPFGAYQGPSLGQERVDQGEAAVAYRDQITSVNRFQLGWRACLPVSLGGERFGVLDVQLSAEPDGKLLSELETVAMAVAFSLGAASRATDEIELARRARPLSLPAEIQWELLPRLALETPAYVVAGTVEPAYDVGGDTFDHAAQPEALTVSITDAMGHGLQAALLAGLAVAALRNARRRPAGLLDQVHHANQALHKQFGGEQFVTGQVLRVDVPGGTGAIVNAGHPLPLRVRGGRVEPVGLDADLPLGLDNATVYHVQQLTLEPGDRLVLHSDGVLEAAPEGGPAFGTARLEGLLRSSQELAPHEVARLLVREVIAHRAGDLADDVTVVCLDWRGPAS
jgi:Stage II sporulation protein E (SpoIIE)